jgi:uncharacterized protein
MTNPSEGDVVLLRIFMGEADQWHHQSLYQALIEAAKKQGLAGATVIRGILSYGARKVYHASHLLELSFDLPIIVEMIDTEEKINQFLPTVDEMVREECLVTLEKLRVYKPQSKKKP